MKVISLFDYTGIMVEPWRDAGYECIIVDIKHPSGVSERDGITCVCGDLMNWCKESFIEDKDLAFICAFPPCDHLAVSGARWFRGKGLRALADSIHMFATAAEICESSGVPYMIENPVSTISTYWRKPDYTFHPWQFAALEPDDCYTKKTCLWTGGGFVMPDLIRYTLDKTPDNRIHAASPRPRRKEFRSATPRGFAKAVFEANRRDK